MDSLLVVPTLLSRRQFHHPTLTLREDILRTMSSTYCLLLSFQTWNQIHLCWLAYFASSLPSLTQCFHDQVTALVFGGLAPVASLLAWALYELARHPEAQTKAARDVEAACEDGASTEDAVWKADYLAAVLWETLRLHPAQPNIYRKLESALKVRAFATPPENEL